jgi:trehalose synthase-fused probable maltokinase
VISSSTLRTVLINALPAFLPRQRWFAAKARRLAGIEVEDLGRLGRERSAVVALALIQARYDDGGAERYCLLLSFSTEERPSAIASADADGRREWIVEAGGEPAAVRALLEGLRSRAPVPTEHGGRVRCGDARGPEGEPGWMEEVFSGSAKPLGAEQSNTSLRLGRRYVFKLFRKIETGENPEVEMGRFLGTRTAFAAAPALRGSVTYDPARGEPSTLGVLQDWVESDGVGFGTVVAGLRGAAPSEGLPERIAADMAALGRTTADLHVALGSDSTLTEFAPEAPSTKDLDSWALGVAARAERVRRLLEAPEGPLLPPTRALAGRFLALLPGTRAGAAFHVPAEAPFRKIRVHGDYHLGQTLRTAGGFVVLDFEGEPGRSFAERRLKQCALKDVAGMTRSFEYAWETARESAPSAGSLPEAGADADPAAAMRATFLTAYRQGLRASRAPLAPERDDTFGAWLDFFELDKALYEIEYELNSRPDWVRIPLRGAVRILKRRAA